LKNKVKSRLFHFLVTMADDDNSGNNDTGEFKQFSHYDEMKTALLNLNSMHSTFVSGTLSNDFTQNRIQRLTPDQRRSAIGEFTIGGALEEEKPSMSNRLANGLANANA
jgi:hypothetical protein